MSTKRDRETITGPIFAIDTLEIPELGVLVRLGAQEPMNMRQLANAAKLGPPAARKLHEKLTRLGLLRTEYARQGAIEITEIRLTPKGREIAELLLPLEPTLARHVKGEPR
jgi:DNA-binding MarR family transcriptional regulator